jgi:hypothetical protein
MQTVQVLLQISPAPRVHDGKQREEFGGLSEQLMPWLAMTSNLDFFFFFKVRSLIRPMN